MKLPRVPCPRCDRPTAVGPVAGRLSKGRLWRHDDPAVRRAPNEPLVSCPGSLDIVDMPLPGTQLEFDVEETSPGAAADGEPESTMPLF